MIRLRKVELLNNVSKNRTPLFFWSLGAGFISTVGSLTIGYFIYTYRIRQRTREGLQRNEIERVIDPTNLTSQEIQKAIVLFEEQKVRDRIQHENYERYKKLRDKRREEKGLA